MDNSVTELVHDETVNRHTVKVWRYVTDKVEIFTYEVMQPNGLVIAEGTTGWEDVAIDIAHGYAIGGV